MINAYLVTLEAQSAGGRRTPWFMAFYAWAFSPGLLQLCSSSI
jgi:hypothetical protein